MIDLHQVQYVADKEGFHVDPSVLPVANPVSHPQVKLTFYNSFAGKSSSIFLLNHILQDTVAVSNAKLHHQQLFDAIAVRNNQAPVVPAALLPVETAAVANTR